ncbi:RagB/SusD family nutrient uptake outer membrane protein [Echinicola strongylocentroti]|uniref:RagB/SusD family nutrient uptake outer membrane protein n=1 Tax=Echinicola strongylocentroti TaxID=1795355 RepID=A0A2Z4IQC9_9BACT|nr:RagB/SusD family nutrient uptake outer membrane protein [Echinicola strongylocentroti]AWW32756.1 RagB/SusD family nutrient uptake outer membrane protein [Echinicola strongylocentroti]
MKSIYKYIFSIGVLVGFSGCSDQLELLPEDQLSEATFWKTPADFKQAANNFYFYFPRPQDLTTVNAESDIETDEIRNDISSGINVIPTSDNRWGRAYERLRDINILLRQAGEYPNPEELNQYVGEAHFFRAYVNFDLFKVFGRYVIVNSVLDVDSPELMAGRNTREESANNIIEDLEAAIPLLPLESEIPGTDKGRVSSQSAQALLSRVALFEGTWQKFRGNTDRANALLDKAANAAEGVMEAGEHELFKGLGEESYRYLFVMNGPESNPGGLTKNDLKEHVIVAKYDQLIRKQGGNISHSMHSYHKSPTKKLLDMYLCEDGLPISMSPLYKDGNPNDPAIDAEFVNRDLRLQNSFRIPFHTYYPRAEETYYEPELGTNTLTGYNWIKFVSIEDIESGEEGFDSPILRYAEVLLNYAEAVFERDGMISDADLNRSINVVRDRVDMPALTNAFVTSNGLDMRTEIRRERTVELASEGQRLLDLKRWKTAEVEMPMDMMGVKITGTNFEDDPDAVYPGLKDGFLLFQDASTRHWEDKHYLDPLPQDQLNLNRNLEQNPGW